MLCAIGLHHAANAIHITLDYSIDERNENWFDPSTEEGRARRGAVGAAAEFLSTIITNDDWNALPTLNESFTFTDIKSPTLVDLNGNTLFGTPESDGEGYAYTSGSNDFHTTNRDSVAANEYVVYVGAFEFDDGSTANAKGGWDSFDYRNAAGQSGLEFNTWGGRIYINTQKNWYAGSPPGIDPTDDYGFQDPNKNPTSDTSSDNWDWSTSSDTWKGFDLRTIDPSVIGQRDLYATAMHELIHALGATSSRIEEYVGVDSAGDFIGPSLIAEYGGPVPGNGGHFAQNVQSIVWGSEDIVSEVVLDPNSLSAVRKYFTRLDGALLSDLGYQVLDAFEQATLDRRLQRQRARGRGRLRALARQPRQRCGARGGQHARRRDAGRLARLGGFVWSGGCRVRGCRSGSWVRRDGAWSNRFDARAPAVQLATAFLTTMFQAGDTFQAEGKVALSTSRLTLFLLAAIAGQAAAAVTEMRMVTSPSPLADGSVLCVAWAGDIWAGSPPGGEMRRLTAHPANDTNPVVSRDGSRVAFCSDRTGAKQVFVMPIEGGAPVRVTEHSEGSTVLDWSPEGDQLLTVGRRDTFGRSRNVCSWSTRTS